MQNGITIEEAVVIVDNSNVDKCVPTTCFEEKAVTRLIRKF